MAAKEAIWDRRCLVDIGQVQEEATTLHCDNQGAIALANNPVFHSRTKHIELHHHFIRDVVERGEIRLSYISTSDNLADLLTKALTTEVHMKHCRSLGIVPESQE